jgi:histidinol-phosphate phosphatase family protein
VITKERPDYVKRVDEMELVPGAGAAIRELSKLDSKIIVVTNQSAVNRRLMTHEELARIHEEMSRRLRSQGCRLDAVYYCPHTPRENCDCRKPRIGLLLRAAKDHDLDLQRSWFIGNTESDAKAALDAGCRYVEVPTNREGSLMDAVSKILAVEHSSQDHR